MVARLLKSGISLVENYSREFILVISVTFSSMVQVSMPWIFGSLLHYMKRLLKQGRKTVSKESLDFLSIVLHEIQAFLRPLIIDIYYTM